MGLGEMVAGWPVLRQLRAPTGSGVALRRRLGIPVELTPAHRDRGQRGEVHLPLLRGRLRPARLRHRRGRPQIEGDPDSPVSPRPAVPEGRRPACS